MTSQTAAVRSIIPAEQEAPGENTPEKHRGLKEPSPRIEALGRAGDADLVGTDRADQAAGFALLMEAVGTEEEPFLVGLMNQLVNAGNKGQEIDAAGEANANFLLSVVKGVEPRDQVEAMLAAQMATVHSATMAFARRLNCAETVERRESAERGFNKLARTFAAQVEALKRYRSRGEQKVRVEHVHVNEGGQAIIGDVSTGEGRGGKKTGL